jgi:ABC-type nickel/cobalt efflux system permease component RcnA
MRALRRRTTAALYALMPVLMAACMLLHPSLALAGPASPFGAGLSEGNIAGASWFPRLVGPLISLQFYFNQHITTAVRAIRHDGSAFWTLLGLSFLYGIVHAAGPGHGKAVVSSYILANRQTLRNGIVLAFIASLAQALGAIMLILVAAMILHMTSVSITNATFRFEILSNVLVVMLGIWLVWSKIIRPARSSALRFTPVSPLTQPHRVLSRASSMGAMAFQAVDAAKLATGPSSGTRPNSHAQPITHKHHSGCECGHAHMPDASVAAGSLDWRKAWTVVASTALRPCTGALIVLVFSISQKLIWAGIAATLVMGLGTAITVASLAVLAVSARQTASVLTGADSPMGRKIIRGVEACGSIAVLLFGLVLLAGNLLLQ